MKLLFKNQVFNMNGCKTLCSVLHSFQSVYCYGLGERGFESTGGSEFARSSVSHHVINFVQRSLKIYTKK
jgi:hypothetical protein